MIRRRHEAARGCPKANHTGTGRRQNENFFVWAGSPTYPSPGGVQASPLLGAGDTLAQLITHLQNEQEWHNKEIKEFTDNTVAIRSCLVAACVHTHITPLLTHLAVEGVIPDPIYPQFKPTTLPDKETKYLPQPPTPRPHAPPPPLSTDSLESLKYVPATPTPKKVDEEGQNPNELLPLQV